MRSQIQRWFRPAPRQTASAGHERTPTERRVQFAEAALKAYTDAAIAQLRDRLHHRHQFGENRVAAMTDARIEKLRGTLEKRVQSAEAGAQAYADQGLITIVSGLRSVNKIVVSLADKIAAEAAITQQNMVSQGADIDGKIQALRSDLLTLRHDLARDYDPQLRAVEQRLEFVRREIFYEMQAEFLKNRTSSATTQSLEPRIINTDKLANARQGPLRLNVGCGHIALDTYLNVDRRDLPGVDIVAEATSLPFSPGEIDEIASAHLIEHFSAPLLERVVLPYWRDLLATGGKLVMVAPDGDAMLAANANGSMTFADFREVLFGAQDYDGDYHFNLLTPQTLRETLERVGFRNIELEYSALRNGKCFEFRMTARRS